MRTTLLLLYWAEDSKRTCVTTTTREGLDLVESRRHVRLEFCFVYKHDADGKSSTDDPGYSPKCNLQAIKRIMNQAASLELTYPLKRNEAEYADAT